MGTTMEMGSAASKLGSDARFTMAKAAVVTDAATVHPASASAIGIAQRGRI
jgi:hypothetical protein